MAEDGPGVRIVSRPRLVRREAVVSLDASRTPAMLLDVGISPRPVRLCAKIFSIYFPSRRFLLYIEGKISRGINGTASVRKPPVSAAVAMVPVDSPNVPKSTSRRFGHFKQLLRNIFEVEKKKDSLR